MGTSAKRSTTGALAKKSSCDALFMVRPTALPTRWESDRFPSARQRSPITPKDLDIKVF
jgi:hypothetical protein